MPATAAWLASAEALLNRCIDSSTRAQALARRLQGTSLQIVVHGIASIRAGTFGGRLALLADDELGAADATISGSLPALLALATSAAPSRPAQISGDAEIGDLYRELFILARPDPEEELSRWMGDLPARRLSEWARARCTWRAAPGAWPARTLRSTFKKRAAIS